MQAGGERFHGKRLGQARHAFEEDMAIGEQADDQTLNEVGLPDDDLAEFVEERAGEGAGLLDFLVDGGDSGVHAAGIVAASRVKAQAGRALQFCKERVGKDAPCVVGTISTSSLIKSVQGGKERITD